MKNKYSKYALFSLITFFFFFITLEVSARTFHFIRVGSERFWTDWYQWGRIVAWHPPRKGVINAFGFHNEEMSLKKTKTLFRILVLGSSTVYGEDDIKSSWTWNLEQLLNESSSGVQYQVLNGGISGGSSHEDVKQLRGTLEFDPDLVIVYSGFNDTYACHYSPQGYMNRQPAYGLRGDLQELKNFLVRHSFALAIFKKQLSGFKDAVARRKNANLPPPAAGDQLSGQVPAADSSDQPKIKKLNIWNETYEYEVTQNKEIIDECSGYYKNNISELYRMTSRRKIPLMIILQPNLAFSLLKNRVSDAARNILKQHTRELNEDWIQASAILYPGLIKVIENLVRANSPGLYAYDFTNLFDGVEERAFADASHQADSLPKQMLAKKVKDLLLEDKLLPSNQTQVHN